ncbi:MAG: preprotein translocase subunit SecG [Planctomycetes bacterium]|nr:preprotein translocase subunit SecG [Planctomycetota bacterium]
MIETITFTFHILLWPLCALIVGLILLQGGAGDISSAFGGGGQLDSTLGVGAGRKMSKLTGWLSAIFLAMVIFLAIPHKSIGFSGAGPAAPIVVPSSGQPGAMIPTPTPGDAGDKPAAQLTSEPDIAPAVVDGAAKAPADPAPVAAPTDGATSVEPAPTAPVEAAPADAANPAPAPAAPAPAK